ncbi:MAG: fatty acid desaturase [Spirochaetia bacterium]|jgi:omega-6 fatty acid desaturase (delta-12 desaturase)
MSDFNTGVASDAPASPARSTPQPRREKPAWVAGLKKYETPNAGKVALQLADTLIPYLALLALMYLTIRWGLPYWVTLLLALPAGALLVRLFIFFHDCCHGSYVRSQLGLQILGNALGVIVFTAYSDWRYSHGIHHSTSGNLDRRGDGDVWTMTLEEYAAASKVKRVLYRFFRSPFVMFGVIPAFSFLILHRLPSLRSHKSQILSVLFTDIALAGLIAAASLTIGITSYLLIQVPVIILGGAGGVWLFYIQHQFDPSYWARTEEWGSMEAALQGSSYYKLPKVLQWISGNIGFHHIHHLRPRIPNYNLQQCLNETPDLQLPDYLSLGRSLKSVHLKVWDEKEKVLLSFRQMSRLLRQPPGVA